MLFCSRLFNASQASLGVGCLLVAGCLQDDAPGMPNYTSDRTTAGGTEGVSNSQAMGMPIPGGSQGPGGGATSSGPTGSGNPSNAGSTSGEVGAGGAATPGDPAGDGNGQGGTRSEGAGGGSAAAAGSSQMGAGEATAGTGRGPTPATASANFPFPQNRESSRCSYPSNYDNDDVARAFEKWRNDTVTADGAGGHLRVKRLDTDPGLEIGSTVSEGIAYGMLIAVYMNEQELFDQLWLYEQRWLTERGLMHWYINAAGTEVLGAGAASDADEDMAWALVMADRQWGGNGALGGSYLDIARDLIDKIWQHEIHEGKLLKPGDQWGDWSSVNVSYFAPNYYRTFAEVTGNEGWNQVVITSYDTLENSLNAQNGNTENGLVPAWCTSEGVPNAGVWGGSDAPTHYQYDSCRTPFRIGLDYCLHGEPRALDYVQKTSRFFSGVGVASIVDGYDLDGSPRPQFEGGQSAAFIGPAGVGAMAEATHQSFVDDAYDAVKGLDLLVGGAYYDESWTVLSLLMMTSNFVDYTQHEPTAAR